MAEEALDSLLQNLTQIQTYDADLIQGFEDSVEDLHHDLVELKSFCKEHSQLYSGNETTKVFTKQIRKMVNMAEDTIDRFLLEASKQEARNKFQKAFRTLDFTTNILIAAKELKIIREKFRKIRERLSLTRQVLSAIGQGFRQIDEEKKAPVVAEENLLGLVDEVNSVISRLIGGSDELEVIIITGMPGLGKTTLANKILEDEMIKYKFFCRAYCYVSQEYSRKEVFVDILDRFKEITSDVYNMSDEKLAEEVYGCLRGIRYLVILDDVWTQGVWESIRVAFPVHQYGRVLITTRSKRVAFSPYLRSSIHNLRFLTLDESRELLRRQLFGNKSFPMNIEEYEFGIARDCGGLPSAIMAIAEQLLSKRNRIGWWKKARENVNLYLALHQEKALGFSHIPHHLKFCFLYLGVFPENFEIPVWRLIRLWIAEGFIPMENNGNLEITAEEYLEELVISNLVLVGQRRLNGRIKTCRIHDTVREFCKRAGTKENLFQEIKGDFASSKSFPDTHRRLSVNSSVSDYISSEPSGICIRSFLSYATEETISTEKVVSPILQAFKLLRVLDIMSISFTYFPQELCQLVLLKYIAISGNFKVLPESMSKLRNVQALIIEISSHVLEIKADIWKMVRLRHLHTNAPVNFVSPASTPEGSKMLLNLQTLSRICPESCIEIDFTKIPNIKKLGIHGKLVGNLTFFDNLGKSHSLENLKLLNDDTNFSLHGLPEAQKFPENLREFTLRNTSLDWAHISTLARLQNLEVLKLKDNAFMGECWQTEDGGFSNLKALHIGRTNLQIWKASGNHFPRLGHLVLRHCRELKGIPSALGDISSLQTIELYDANSSVVSSAKKIQLLKLRNQAKLRGTRSGMFKLSTYDLDQ